MTEHLCIRCHLPVLLEDGHLVYCSHCGAPQIFLSEELQDEIAEGVRAYNERTAPATSAIDSPHATETESRPRWSALPRRNLPGQQPWPLAVQYALLSAGIALALGLASLLLPPVGLLTILWVIAAPILTVGVFHARSLELPPPGSFFAARLGLLTGLLVAFCCALVFTLSLVLTRFVFHDAALLDTQLATSFAQQRATVIGRLGASVQPTVDLFAIPEYRVGLLLSVIATSGAIYLFLSTLAGGVAGLLLRRRRSA